MLILSFRKEFWGFEENQGLFMNLMDFWDLNCLEQASH